MADTRVDELLDRALQLPAAERVRLAREIWKSVEQFELTDEQRAALREAMDEIDRGEYINGDMFLPELGTAG